MIDFEKYKWSIITILIISMALMIILAVGFTIGILSEDPDGLERALIDAKGDEWLEDLPSPWEPLFLWINNDYIVGILGLVLSVVLMIMVFYLILHVKKEKA